MSQKFIKLKNNNRLNTAAYGKYYATAVYDNHFVETDEIADYIQRQASVKKSDIKAVLQELGEAMKHFFEMGQKIKLEGIGILKVDEPQSSALATPMLEKPTFRMPIPSSLIF